jgi:hypothetical protein
MLHTLAIAISHAASQTVFAYCQYASPHLCLDWHYFSLYIHVTQQQPTHLMYQIILDIGERGFAAASTVWLMETDVVSRGVDVVN